jgi:putative DNA primase/helicase
LRAARPSLPSGLSDRKADVWEPLLAIADLAGGEWPTRARQAALALAGAVVDTDVVVELLADVADIIVTATDTVIPTKMLLDKLIEREERPWATWRHDKPITARGLARLLGPLGVHPLQLERVRGYRVDAFTDPIARYLATYPCKRQKPNKDGDKSPISMCAEDTAHTHAKTQETSIKTGSLTPAHIDPGVTGKTDEEGDRAVYSGA